MKAAWYEKQGTPDVLMVGEMPDPAPGAGEVRIRVSASGIAAYATGNANPTIPFWRLLFKNARLLLLGSDDFPVEAKLAAAQETNALLADGWQGIRIDRRFALDDIAAAHRYAQGRPRGRVVLET